VILLLADQQSQQLASANSEVAHLPSGKGPQSWQKSGLVEKHF